MNQDRLYELLPTIYRMRDYEQGESLRALLRVISEQVNLLEEDITQLYENWFIETCEDWVVPYIGDLIGYEPVHEAGEVSALDSRRGRQRDKVLISRREVANTIRYRRRKGTLALLELLANDVAGWPARAVEYYTLLSWTQAVNHLRLERGRTVDLSNGSALELVDTPFDALAHTIDVRRIHSSRRSGRYNIPSIGLFIWRLRSYPVTRTPAYCQEAEGPHCFTFSVLGNDSPLYIDPQAEADPTHIAEQLNLPIPITRRFLEQQKDQLYGIEKSLQIWVGVSKGKKIKRRLVPLKTLVVADLSDWGDVPHSGAVAVDPQLGRIAFPSRQWPKQGVWVSYHYGFSAELGGGEYARPISQPAEVALYRVGKGEKFKTINEALQRWSLEGKAHAVIEIADSGVYVEPITIDITNGQESLQVRAATRTRPVIRLLDWQTDRPDSMAVSGDPGSSFILDGIVITGRGLRIAGDLTELTIRHATLVPGWTLGANCEPSRSTEPSLEVFAANVCVKIEHSIVGAIQVDPAIPLPAHSDPGQADGSGDKTDPYWQEPELEPENEDVMPPRCRSLGGEVRLDPIRVCISDSVLDATDSELEVLGMPGCPVAHATLNIVRSTVFGHLQVHAIELGEDCIFNGKITVARRQHGCLRFSYITPGSRTPRRFHCQPDLVEQRSEQTLHEAAEASMVNEPTEQELKLARHAESLRVRPRFNSTRYGMPLYCQLADSCAQEIKIGAQDESEMGAFHDLYQPQREASLKIRIQEYVPAGADAGVIHAS